MAVRHGISKMNSGSVLAIDSEYRINFYLLDCTSIISWVPQNRFNMCPCGDT